ncbi:hypothetical protein SteCoe_20777 [Stentor coeruleus]|uniref:ADP/ATP translocase n=1 Tax=Stentor coeruleus TaxID=5963 RepID=A0A1R2BRK8_9CILI|nr:hypothetical protein SteCoe_20777 [Stentor coeruleus]
MEKPSNFLLDFTLGGFSAGLSKTIVAPIERVKLLLQLQDVAKGMVGKEKYKGMFDCAVQVNKTQGFMSFWRGNTSNVLRYFPSQAINFAVKEQIKPLFAYKGSSFLRKAFNNFMAGGIAGAISLVVVYPLDFIRTRMAADVGKMKSDREFTDIMCVVKKIMQSDGIVGLYRGVTISILFSFLYRAIYFGGFDTGMSYFYPDSKKSNIIYVWALAQTITFIAGYVVYPLDTVRRRLMMQSGRQDTVYKNSFDCFRKIYYEEGGFQAFFKGAGTNAIRGLGGALVLVFFNEGKNAS